MQNGWVKLHRQITENSLWFSEPFTKGQAWIDLILNANHEDGSFWIRGIEIKLKRGQIGWSQLTMSTRWKWSRNKVRRFLNWLESEQQIKQQNSAKTSIITLLNYDKYQNTEQQTEQQKDNRRNTNKNVKKNKNVKNKEITHIAANSVAADINKIFEKFQLTVNPTIQYGNKTQRKAADYLIKQFTLERVLSTIDYLAEIQGDKFAPTITTPYQLKEKMGALIAYHKKQSSIQSNVASI